MNNIGNHYSYVDPHTGENVVVAGEEQHNDQFAVLRRTGPGNPWEFDAAHQLRRTAELAIEHRVGQHDDGEFTIVELFPASTGAAE